MTSESLATIASALGAVAAGIMERLRHEGANSVPHQSIDESVRMEALRVRGEGQTKLADALLALLDTEGNA